MKYITPAELEAILCATLFAKNMQETYSEIGFQTKVWDANGEVLGTIGYADNGEIGFILGELDER